MLDWLKPILGDGYNEEIDNKIAAEINKGFVAKADYDAAKDAQRTAAEAFVRRSMTCAARPLPCTMRVIIPSG